ncbi:MAG TPA: BatA domain-containing protein, partial [Gemmataceae bacterium]|nr:BatA domain-containing protein [Gemmataceae bacterium]
MEALFSSPLTMVAGAALVSAPIIIHLINRMRFRRIRWAAMEFLLKAQKRMRRKLILEQLILLFLRCLLVFLVAVLVARFKWFSPLQHQDVRSTAHVVILDDTPSMGDRFGVGDQPTAFDQGKAVVWDKIAPAAAQSNTPQSMHILRLSELHRKRTPEEAAAVDEKERNKDIPNQKSFRHLNTAQVEEIKAYLADLNPASVRVNLVKGLETAEQVLAEQTEPETLRVVHIVTDLRAIDWAEDGEALKEKIGGLTRAGVQVHLIDVASPHRRRSDRVPRSSDNVAIVEFRPLTRVAAKDQPVDFEVRVKNFGAAEVSNVQLKFYRNGKGNIITTREIASLPPGQERRETVQVQFSQVATPQKPLDRFNVVTVALSFPENGGLTTDNVRHAVIEVEENRRVLVIEGRKDLRGTPEGDGFYLRKLFTGALQGIKWEDGDITDLETKDLRQYACIYLLNVRDVPPSMKDPRKPEDYVPKKLEEYVREGGGLAVFLGPNVDPKRYNQTLYRDGQGLFPVQLPDKPTDIPTPDQFIKRQEQRANELTKWVLTRDPAAKTHPALAGLYTNERGLAIK